MEARLLDRRIFLAGAATALLGACTATGPTGPVAMTRGSNLLLPETDEPFRVAPVDLSVIPAQYHRREVADPTGEAPGTIVVDPAQRFLYLVEADGRAMRYGIGVGREGFAWNGTATIAAKRKWPAWHPPVEMQERDESARKWKNGMPGGSNNPLGARAMYLYKNGRDTLYRIHGTTEAALHRPGDVVGLHPHAQRRRDRSLRARAHRHQGGGSAGAGSDGAAEARASRVLPTCRPASARAGEQHVRRPALIRRDRTRKMQKAGTRAGFYFAWSSPAFRPEGSSDPAIMMCLLCGKAKR